MAIKVNQSKQYRIYIKESKSWVDINKDIEKFATAEQLTAHANSIRVRFE